MDKKVAGYAVKAYEHYRTEEGRKYYIVLADPSSGQMWVTWECTNGNDFYWGHYFTSEAAARSDFHKRLAEKYAAY
jgi:predicted DNA-binding WGR domain protein